jgi:hypothetical protein
VRRPGAAAWPNLAPSDGRRDNYLVPVHPTVKDIEIKVNVAGEDAEWATRELGLAASDAKRRRIWFYEHVDGIGGSGALPLFRRQVIVRVRRMSGGDGDITIKLRGTDLVLPEAWIGPAQGDGWKFKIEGDWTGQRHATAASLTVDVEDVNDVEDGAGAPDLEVLVTDRQVSFLHASLDLPIDVSALEGIGPIDARTWSPTTVGFDEDVAAERWRAGELEFLELSLRVNAARALDVQAAFERFLTDRRVRASSLEQTKTETVLRHLATRR